MANVVRQDIVQIQFEVGKMPFDDINKQMNATQKNVKGGFDGISESFKETSKAAKGIKDDFKLFDDIVASVKGKASSLSTAAARSVREFKNLVSVKLTKLKTGFTDVKNTLTQGQSGARGFVALLKSIGKISVARLYRGVTSLKSGLSSVASGFGNLAKTSFTNLVNGVKNLGTKLKTALTTAGKLALKLGALGAGAVIAGVTALGTSAIKGYAEYEQLVGGVETLFKGSSKEVIGYAANAYKTAGLSANQYMETVTSFSASLLQSLGGDTKKAASVADLAITDMSDNANKMGTSMESIQNAYQGFAKQNYTMLDNLKLGYGGTKEEMQRLLKDAQKISGQKFDLSSYADIVKAIHVVQTEMGITGTTAKEASSTIQGSFNAMKGAWSNFLTGMADPKQNFDTLVNNLVESVVTFAKNLIPRIKVMLPRLTQGIAELINALVPEIPGLFSGMIPVLGTAALNLIRTFKSMLLDNAPQLMSGAMSLVEKLGQFLLESISNIPNLVQSGTNLLLNLVQGLLDAIPMLLQQAPVIIQNLVTAFTQALPMLIETGIKLIDMVAQGLTTMLPQLTTSALTIIQTLFNGLMQNLPVILNGALRIIMSLVNGLLQNLPLILTSAIQIIMALAQGILQNLPTIITMALQVIVALATGLIQAIPTLLAAIPTIFSAFVEGIKSVDWLTTGVDILKAIGNGILNGVSQIGSSIWGAVKGIFGGGDNKAEAKTSGVETMGSYSAGLTSGTSGITNATSGISTSLSTNLTADLTGAGTSTIGTFNTGLTSGVQGITGVTTGVGDGIKTDLDLDINTQGLGTMETFNTGLGVGGDVSLESAKATATGVKEVFSSVNLAPVGKNIMSGLRTGMESMRSSVLATARSIANSVSSTINNALDIHSPSRVTAETGVNVGLGAVKGMEETMPSVRKASLELGNTIADGSKTGYAPTRTAASRTENNSYAPVFNLTINGSDMSERELEKKFKRWLAEAVDDMEASINRRRMPAMEV